jgi:hypothetical protein
MTHAEAVALAAERNAEAAQDEHWLVREADDGAWAVARITGPGVGAARPTGAHVESRARPEEPADPRPAVFQNVPPFGAG